MYFNNYSYSTSSTLTMKKFFTTLTIFAMALCAYAQGTVKGVIVDNDGGDALIGASVLIKGTSKGTITDIDGSFSIATVTTGDATLIISYTGYSDMEKAISVTDGENDLGNIELVFDAVGLKEIEIIASVATARKTPVAISTLKAEEIQAKIGSQEFPEVLKKTPSIYATKSGGGFGDARINVRGFDQTNTAVMINGIPVNDMENGRVFWSNWAGLSEVSSSIQVQRGLGASNLAVPAVGGSINVVTKAADVERKGIASVSIGNDGYQKYGVTLSSGLLDNGWAVTAQGTHTLGDGYVDGTNFKAWSYFLSVSKNIGDNQSLGFSVVGAPQWHHQRLGGDRFNNVTLQTFQDKGIRYNHTWGMLNGEVFNFRRNFYHKPKAFLNHYWTINDKTDLKTSAYVSMGRGGGTGPRGRLRTNGTIFDSYSGDGKGIHNSEGQIRFDDIVAYNQGANIEGFGQKEVNPVTGNYIVGEDGRIYYDADGNIVSDDHSDFDTRDATGSGFIRRASMNSHNWFGILSKVTSELADGLTLTAGIDARYYKGIHYRRLENLLGADGYLSKSDINNQGNLITTPVAAEFGSFSDNTHDNGDNVLNYYNDGLVSWFGGFAQLEYSTDKLTAVVSFNASNQGFKRVDYFNYLASDSARESDWQNFLGGVIKGGVNYNIDNQSNVFFNGGYISRQPIFDNVFVNFRNDVNEDATNQKIYAFEAGYGFRSGIFKGNVNVYHTNWGNRQFDRSFRNYEYVFNGDSLVVDATANFSNVDQLHQGIEFEFDVTPSRMISFDGSVSLGNWRYTNNFTTQLIDTDNSRKIDDVTVFAEDLKIGDAAQTSFAVGTVIKPVNGLSIYIDGVYYDNLYGQFNIATEEQFLSPGGKVVKLDSYFLMDAGLSYGFDLAGMRITANLNVNNVLDTEYVAELFTNIVDDPTTEVNEFMDNQGFYGFGRTWNAGLKFRF